MDKPFEPSVDRLAVSPAEAARLIGIGRTKLDEALGSGDLVSAMIGARRLIRVSDLKAWFAAHEESRP